MENYFQKIAEYFSGWPARATNTELATFLTPLIEILDSFIEENCKPGKSDATPTEFLTRLENYLPKQGRDRSIIQLSLLAAEKAPITVAEELLKNYYKIWASSFFNPSQINSETQNKFPFEKFGIHELKLPFQLLDKPGDAGLPIISYGSNFYSYCTLGDYFRNVSNNEVQTFESRLVPLKNEDSYTPVYDDDNLVISSMSYDEEDDKYFTQIYDVPQNRPYHLFCPLLFIGNFTNLHTGIDTLFLKDTETIATLPSFLMAALGKLIHRDDCIDFLASLNIEERRIKLTRPLSQYDGLQYLQRASIVNFFTNTERYGTDGNTTALQVGASGISYANMNFLCKVGKVLKEPEKPKGILSSFKQRSSGPKKQKEYPAWDEFIITLELISFNLYTVYSTAKFIQGYKKLMKVNGEEIGRASVTYSYTKKD